MSTRYKKRTSAVNAKRRLCGLLFCRYEFIIALEQRLPVGFDIVEYDRGPADDRGQRIGCYDNRHAERAGEKFRKAADERPSARKVDTALHHIGQYLRLRRFQYFFYRLHELFYRVADGIAHVLVRDAHLA